MKIELYRIFEIIKNARAISQYKNYKKPIGPDFYMKIKEIALANVFSDENIESMFLRNCGLTLVNTVEEPIDSVTNNITFVVNDVTDISMALYQNMMEKYENRTL